MGSWNDFEAGLERMLKDVWRNRSSIRGLPPQNRATAIYRYYNDAPAVVPAPAPLHGVDVALVGFLLRLDGIMKKTPGLQVLVQYAHDEDWCEYPACAERFSRRNSTPRPPQLDQTQLNNALYHVRPIGVDVKVATKRVYVHAAPGWKNCIERWNC